MLDHIANTLAKFQHNLRDKPEHVPYAHVIPSYGVKVQYAQNYNTAEALDKIGINTI